MLLATFLALAPVAAVPQGGAGEPAPQHMPTPVHRFEPDLKALLDPRSPQAPLRPALATFAAAAFGDLAPALLPDRPPLPAVNAAQAELSALAGGAGASWTRTIDRLHFDAPGDGSLWVRGASYKAQVAADAFTYVPFLGSRAPRNFPVRLELRSATVDGRPLALAAPTLVREGALVTVDRGALLEQYRFELEAVEQLFVLERLDLRGELQIELALASELAPRALGAGLELEGESGGVRYGGVTVLDAAGRSVALPSCLEDGRIVLRVPADFVERATLPLTVDPLITTLDIETGPLEAKDPDVAYTSHNDIYVVVWQEAYSATDADVYALQLDGAGSPVIGAYVDFTGASWLSPTVASKRAGAAGFAAAAEVAGEIRGRRIEILSGTMGPVQLLASGAGHVLHSPALGGNDGSTPPTFFMLTYVREFAQGDSDIHAVLLDDQAAPASATILIDNSGGTVDVAPRISKTGGATPPFPSRWNLAWSRVQPGGNHYDVRYAQVRSDGHVMTPSTPLLSSPANEFAWSVSPPLDDFTGGPREWVVLVSQSGPPEKLLGALLDDGTLRSFTDLSGIGWTVGSQSAVIDSQGCTFGVAFARTTPQGSAVLLTGLRSVGTGLQVSEAPVHLDLTPDPTRHVALAQTTIGPRGLAVWNEGVNGSSGQIYGALHQLADHCVGSSSCSSTANSTGYQAHLRAVGSADVFRNRLFLTCDNLPPFQPGLFLTSKVAASIPFSQGTLCLAPPVRRFAQFPQNAGPFGVVSLRVDLANPPPGVIFSPGSTWHFQYWTRDGGPTNFSNSVTVQLF